MKRSRRLSRRTVLRGLGTAIALPWLEAMAPAAGRDWNRIPLRPRRPVPCGWRSSTFPTAFTWPTGGPRKRAPASPSRRRSNRSSRSSDELLVLTGLAQHNSEALGDGGGDHARALSCFLTGVHPLKTDGANIHAGVSVDQVAAQSSAGQTRLPSLELGIERGGAVGQLRLGL